MKNKSAKSENRSIWFPDEEFMGLKAVYDSATTSCLRYQDFRVWTAISDKI
jgi:hypothetical protein